LDETRASPRTIIEFERWPFVSFFAASMNNASLLKLALSVLLVNAACGGEDLAPPLGGSPANEESGDLSGEEESPEDILGAPSSAPSTTASTARAPPTPAASDYGKYCSTVERCAEGLECKTAAPLDAGYCTRRSIFSCACGIACVEGECEAPPIADISELYHGGFDVRCGRSDGRQRRRKDHANGSPSAG
jgi:hypothetical protein